MARPKPVNWQHIEPNDEYNTEVYEIINGLIETYHGGEVSIEGVHCVAMWRHGIKIDQDDYILLTDISKSTDKMRELYPHDMVIGINKDAWSFLDEAQRKVVIDAQLERIAICLDKDDIPKEDDRSRFIYRLRRPEVLDEATLTRRHGLTMQQVQDFICDKFQSGDAEEGSYVANALDDKEDGDSEDPVVEEAKEGTPNEILADELFEEISGDE